MTEARFYIDHGVIHDRVTGKHVVTDGVWPHEDDLRRVLALLNSLAPPGERLMPISDINDLDDVCHELGIQDSPVTPAQAVRELKHALEMAVGPKPTRGGPTERHPDAPYYKPDQSCCDFCCGN